MYNYVQMYTCSVQDGFEGHGFVLVEEEDQLLHGDPQVGLVELVRDVPA